uniref:Uncharacterized protein n=1 Tax=Anguilla anguilla TaxID=7936 RepID=A0A0E9W0V6_ANGAN
MASNGILLQKNTD